MSIVLEKGQGREGALLAHPDGLFRARRAVPVREIARCEWGMEIKFEKVVMCPHFDQGQG